MAYKKSVVEAAKHMYMVEGKTARYIAEKLGVAEKTVYTWIKRHGWNRDIASPTGFNLLLDMQKEFASKIKEVTEDGTLTDPAVADSLWKVAKLMERMAPQRVQLSNLFQFMDDMVSYFSISGESEEFLKRIQAHIPKLGDYLRKKYMVNE